MSKQLGEAFGFAHANSRKQLSGSYGIAPVAG